MYVPEVSEEHIFYKKISKILTEVVRVPTKIALQECLRSVFNCFNKGLIS